MGKINIGVTGTGSLVGQAIIKSIKNSTFCNEFSIIGFDYIRNTIGSYWVDRNYLLPDFLKKGVKEGVWLKELIEQINVSDIKAILIGIDFELRLFAKYKKFIESQTKCKVLVSDLKVIEIADDKYLTYQFLKNNDLYYPETVLAKEFEKKLMRFPVILKPRRGTSSRDVFIIKDSRELKKRIAFIKDAIIQEAVGDVDSEYTCGAICLDTISKDKIIALKRFLKGGDTETAYFSKDTPKEIYDYVYKICCLLKPFGMCNFQLRLDKNGIPRLFEINARHSGTTYIRSLFGFNEVEYILGYLFNLKPKKLNLRYGMVKRFYDEMFIPAS